MTRFSCMIGSVCILLSGMCAALPQAQITTGISTTAHATSHPSASSTQPKTPLRRAALKTDSSARKTTAAKTKKSGKQSAAVVEPAPIVTLPPPQQVQPPLRPEQMPPVPAKVTYQNGLLMVQAPNSTLSDIFNGIRTRASIQFEGAQGASDRVAANFGPAPADQVLAALLRGSRFDYVSEIIKHLGLPNEVKPVSSDYFPRSAPVPAWEALDNYCLKLRGILKMRPWQEALEDYVRNRFLPELNQQQHP